MLNVLWLGFFLVGALSAAVQWLVLGNEQIFSRMVTSLFDMAALSVQIMLVLFGTLTLWLGFLRIAESAGLVNTLARWLGPLFARLMPGVPRGHPAIGLITLNFAANALGLDNAATPIGLRAMRELQPSAAMRYSASKLFPLPITVTPAAAGATPVTSIPVMTSTPACCTSSSRQRNSISLS